LRPSEDAELKPRAHDTIYRLLSQMSEACRRLAENPGVAAGGWSSSSFAARAGLW
jgi:hypothetical protein